MATMTLFNVGKRAWKKGQVRGLPADLEPHGNIEMDEVVARRLVMDYPGEFSLAGRATPSSDELARREQSIRDREANLDKRESDLDAREVEIHDREIACEKDSVGGENLLSTKSDLIAEARSLGIDADSRWGAKKLAEVIAEKKAAK
jgi:hypothetical protein